MAEEKQKELPVQTLNVNIVPDQETKEELVKPEQMLSHLFEVLGDIREDRHNIDETLNSFLNMVMNDGDASHSSKEALVNLIKLKLETSDKKTKVVELMMRAYLKDREAIAPKYHQYNEFKFGSQSKKQIIKAIQSELDDKDEKSLP